MRLYTAAQARELDRRTIEEHGVPSLTLMENAAAALAEKAAEIAKKPNAAVFCGSGNNGGDGIAAARLLKGKGFTVRAFLVGSREKLTPDSRAMEERLKACGLTLEDWTNDDKQKAFTEDSGVVIDALLGTGLNSPVRGRYTEVIRWLNGLGRPIVSADVPSGVSADTGAVLGEAIDADATVTFGGPKVGQFVEPGCIKAGALTVADIGILPDTEINGTVKSFAFTGENARQTLPKRPPLSHKGDYGKLLLLGGSVGFTGAPWLAAEAAVRSGAGLVYLGVPEDIYSIEAVKCVEAMPFPVRAREGKINGQDPAVLRELKKRLSSCTLCLAGPGLGRGPGPEALILWLLERCRVPLILDADGINALAGHIDWLDRAACPVVLTPHEGEFARLGGRIGEDRLGAARAFAEGHHCVLVLKGHRTITALPDGRCWVNTCGNPGMAKGGSGDVLSGVLAALAARLPLEQAIPLGVWLHSRAGDLAAAKYGENSMTPSDMLAALPEAFSGS